MMIIGGGFHPKQMEIYHPETKHQVCWTYFLVQISS